MKSSTRFIRNSDIYHLYNIFSLLHYSVVFLFGEMGVGKTYFVKKYFHHIGGDENKIVSPSFTLINEILFLDEKILHADFYRISDTQRKRKLYASIAEQKDSKTTAFIEWPEENGFLNPNFIIHVFNNGIEFTQVLNQ